MDRSELRLIRALLSVRTDDLTAFGPAVVRSVPTEIFLPPSLQREVKGLSELLLL